MEIVHVILCELKNQLLLVAEKISDTFQDVFLSQWNCDKSSAMIG